MCLSGTKQINISNAAHGKENRNASGFKEWMKSLEPYPTTILQDRPGSSRRGRVLLLLQGQARFPWDSVRIQSSDRALNQLRAAGLKLKLSSRHQRIKQQTKLSSRHQMKGGSAEKKMWWNKESVVTRATQIASLKGQQMLRRS